MEWSSLGDFYLLKPQASYQVTSTLWMHGDRWSPPTLSDSDRYIYVDKYSYRYRPPIFQYNRRPDRIYPFGVTGNVDDLWVFQSQQVFNDMARSSNSHLPDMTSFMTSSMVWENDIVTTPTYPTQFDVGVIGSSFFFSVSSNPLTTGTDPAENTKFSSYECELVFHETTFTLTNGYATGGTSSQYFVPEIGRNFWFTGWLPTSYVITSEFVFMPIETRVGYQLKSRDNVMAFIHPTSNQFWYKDIDVYHTSVVTSYVSGQTLIVDANGIPRNTDLDAPHVTEYHYLASQDSVQGGTFNATSDVTWNIIYPYNYIHSGSFVGGVSDHSINEGGYFDGGSFPESSTTHPYFTGEGGGLPSFASPVECYCEMQNIDSWYFDYDGLPFYPANTSMFDDLVSSFGDAFDGYTNTTALTTRWSNSISNAMASDDFGSPTGVITNEVMEILFNAAYNYSLYPINIYVNALWRELTYSRHNLDDFVSWTGSPYEFPKYYHLRAAAGKHQYIIESISGPDIWEETQYADAQLMSTIFFRKTPQFCIKHLTYYDNLYLKTYTPAFEAKQNISEYSSLASSIYEHRKWPDIVSSSDAIFYMPHSIETYENSVGDPSFLTENWWESHYFMEDDRLVLGNTFTTDKLSLLNGWERGVFVTAANSSNLAIYVSHYINVDSEIGNLSAGYSLRLSEPKVFLNETANTFGYTAQTVEQFNRTPDSRYSLLNDSPYWDGVRLSYEGLPLFIASSVVFPFSTSIGVTVNSLSVYINSDGVDSIAGSFNVLPSTIFGTYSSTVASAQKYYHTASTGIYKYEGNSYIYRWEDSTLNLMTNEVENLRMSGIPYAQYHDATFTSDYFYVLSSVIVESGSQDSAYIFASSTYTSVTPSGGWINLASYLDNQSFVETYMATSLTDGSPIVKNTFYVTGDVTVNVSGAIGSSDAVGAPNTPTMSSYTTPSFNDNMWNNIGEDCYLWWNEITPTSFSPPTIYPLISWSGDIEGIAYQYSENLNTFIWNYLDAK